MSENKISLIFADAISNISNLPRYIKKIIVIFVDICLCIICTWLSFYLRLEEFIKFDDITSLSVIISVFLAIPLFWILGLYHTIFRYAGSSIIFTVFVCSSIYSLIYFTIIGVYGIQGIPRSIGIIQPILLFLGIFSSRIAIKYFFLTNFKNKYKKQTLIYGAGSAGRQLLSILENNTEIKVVGFLDDNPQFHGEKILGQTVYDPSNINKKIIAKNIDLVLLALPSISRQRRNYIIERLNQIKVIVKTLPNIEDIVNGNISFSDIKDLSIEDLLSRNKVFPNTELLSKNIESKTVLVTGAGGSIGSEISRQIVNLKPKKLLLLDQSEFALYKICEELKNTNNDFKIISLLANIQDSSKVKEILKTFKVDTIYHAAAYKHVPLVEENICESVKNNVFGTLSLTQSALKYNVANFVLISSDKAVRPTNIMGATKRLAEICVQSLHAYQNKYSKFSIVRFGNVLESSGSVIPKFKNQIKSGGPVTLTHPDVTRFFMTTTEAAQLVIQAGAMSNNCEVFILDMGKSIKIIDLIHKMIKLSGLTVKNSENKYGDIEVKIIGLRSGEKLYEELLIGKNPQKTHHEKIYKAKEPFIVFDKLKIELDDLLNLIEGNKIAEVKEKLSFLIPSFHSNSKIIDNFYEEKFDSKNDLKLSIITNNKENKVTKINTK